MKNVNQFPFLCESVPPLHLQLFLSQSPCVFQLLKFYDSYFPSHFLCTCGFMPVSSLTVAGGLSIERQHKYTYLIFHILHTTTTIVNQESRLTFENRSFRIPMSHPGSKKMFVFDLYLMRFGLLDTQCSIYVCYFYYCYNN